MCVRGVGFFSLSLLAVLFVGQSVHQPAYTHTYHTIHTHIRIRTYSDTPFVCTLPTHHTHNGENHQRRDRRR
jgi:hypothetical protein